MGKFDLYKIPLRSFQSGSQEFTYNLNDKYFKDIDSEEIRKGNVDVQVLVKKITGAFEFTFNMEGTVKVPCDRCLDDVEMPVAYKGKLFVKFGKSYSEESEDIIVIPEDDGEINIAWFLYEFAVLSLPMKRIHPPGKCNKVVSEKLEKHAASDEEGDSEVNILPEGDSEDKETDPRWDKLKDINFE